MYIVHVQTNVHDTYTYNYTYTYVLQEWGLGAVLSEWDLGAMRRQTFPTLQSVLYIHTYIYHPHPGTIYTCSFIYILLLFFFPFARVKKYVCKQFMVAY